MSTSAALESLENNLEMFIENVRQVRIIVSDFQPQGHNVLNHKLQAMVAGLQEINKLRPQVSSVLVPYEVFDYIDEGKNPQLYTKDCIEKALTKNEQVKGQIDSFKELKTQMINELSNTFAVEMDVYRDQRKKPEATTDSDVNDGTSPAPSDNGDHEMADD